MPVDEPGEQRRTCGSPVRGASKKQGGGLLPNFSLSLNKSALREAILRQLRAELTLQASAAALARDEATNEESRARSKYETHSQEAAYLAQGQARLVQEIETSLEAYAALPFPDFAPTDAIALGAVVELQAGARRIAYFVGPRAGGMELTIDGREILVVTPQSPLGRQLVGKHAGDLVTGPGRGAAAQQRIVAVE